MLIGFLAYWCEHPDLFAAIADASNEEDRALAVLKWFIVSSYLSLFFTNSWRNLEYP
jgi:hypothetical protein